MSFHLVIHTFKTLPRALVVQAGSWLAYQAASSWPVRAGMTVVWQITRLTGGQYPCAEWYRSALHKGCNNGWDRVCQSLHDETTRCSASPWWVVAYLLALLLALLLCWIALPSIEAWWRYFSQAVSGWLKDRVIARLPTDALRAALRTVPVAKAAKLPDHTHGSAAAARGAAKRMLDVCVALMARDNVHVQASASDLDHGRKHITRWFWAKDVAVDQQADRPNSNAAYVLCDVDYYVDMPNFLSTHYPCPVLLYTFTPQTAAGTSYESTFHFDQEGRLVTEVAGGGKYVHPLWDWNHDFVAITRSLSTVYYQVEKRYLGEHRSLVLLAPLARIRAPWSYGFALEAHELQRFNPLVGPFAVMRTRGGAEAKVSIAPVSSGTCVTLPEASFDSLVETAKLTTTALQTYAVASELTRAGVANAATLAPIATAYIRSVAHSGKVTHATVFPGAVSYERMSALQIAGRPSMAAFMQPFIPASVAPVISLPNERWCVQSRVYDPAANSDEFDLLPGVYLQYAVEFVEFMIPERHCAHPVDYDEIVTRQPRASQQAILKDAEQLLEDDRPLQSLLKKQAEGKINPARNITTQRGAEKRNYSQYLYAATNILKKQKWYAFGKTPVEVAHDMARICSKSDQVDESDFERMDAKHTRPYRTVETMLMVAYFSLQYTEDLLRNIAKQSNRSCVGELGTRFVTKAHRLTGTAETSWGNTVDNAFTVFCAFRNEGHDKDAAWQALEEKGLYAGDDGHTGDIPEGAIGRAAATLGMKVKSDIVQRGSLGVNFLARYYGPDVWNGDPNSCTDPLRAVGKFHLTLASSTLPPLAKFVEKAYAYELSDSQTPVLCAIVRRAKLERTKSGLTPTGEDLSYLQRGPDGLALPEAVQYPNRCLPWALELWERQCPGIDPAILNDWASGEGDWAAPPLVYAPPPPKPAEVPVVLDFSPHPTIPALPDVDLAAVNAADDALLASTKMEPTDKGKDKVAKPTAPAKRRAAPGPPKPAKPIGKRPQKPKPKAKGVAKPAASAPVTAPSVAPAADT